MIEPPPGYARVGLDDGGTGTGSFKGWAAVLLDSVAEADLSARAARILSRFGLSEFHGRDFRPAMESPYRAFASAILEVCKTASVSWAGFALLPRNVYSDFVAFAKKLAVRSYQSVDPRLVESRLKHVAEACPPLFWFAGEASKATLAVREIAIDVDVSTAVAGIGAPIFVGPLCKLGNQWTASLYRAYVKVQLLHAPRVLDDGVRFVDSKESHIVQAADLIANFGLNHLRYLLAGEAVTAGMKMKSKIFTDTFDIDGSLRGFSSPGLSWSGTEIECIDQSQIPYFRLHNS